MKPLLPPIAVSKGDKIRFVSPASTPDEEAVRRRAEQLSAHGYQHDFGLHAFSKYGPFAGPDNSRLGDLNVAFADDTVNAIFATRGGKGSYRIADSVDFDLVMRKPKWLVGFSDITVLQMALLRECGLPGIHGALYVDENGELSKKNLELLLAYISGHGAAEFHSDPDNPTARMTISGSATGRMVGGNLDTLATGAGWALPVMEGCILMLEAVDCQPGRIDRALTLLRKGGHIDWRFRHCVGSVPDSKCLETTVNP